MSRAIKIGRKHSKKDVEDRLETWYRKAQAKRRNGEYRKLAIFEFADKCHAVWIYPPVGKASERAMKMLRDFPDHLIGIYAGPDSKDQIREDLEYVKPIIPRVRHLRVVVT